MEPTQRTTENGTDTHRNAPTTRGYRNAAVLRELYHGHRLTTREIADRFNCSNGTISRWLNRHGIQTRDNWRAGVDAAQAANREERVAQRTLPSGYEYWASQERQPDGDRINRIVYVHRLLAVAEHGYDAVTDQDVHHQNHIPWDNRPENIELRSHEDHGQLHANDRWDNEVSA